MVDPLESPGGTDPTGVDGLAELAHPETATMAEMSMIGIRLIAGTTQLPDV